jgi:hypothetical protein
MLLRCCLFSNLDGFTGACHGALDSSVGGMILLFGCGETFYHEQPEGQTVQCGQR